jgi:hypothetical protein
MELIEAERSFIWVSFGLGRTNMKDHKAEDHAALASHLFQALCALYPDRYVAMIRPNDPPNIRPELPTITTAEAPLAVS